MRSADPRTGAHRTRLSVLRLLIASLLLTLLARLSFVQLLDQHKPLQSAGLTHLGAIVIPAPRGEILDSRGRVLVGNRSTHVLTVDRSALDQQDDGGAAVLARLAPVLGTSAADLRREITPCGVKVPAPCWTGQPYQPVPVATGIDASVLLAVSEHAELFPGVRISTQTVLNYPGGSLAAHLLGYTGAVGQSDQKANKALVDADTIGRSGLEESYDAVLRGVDGEQRVQLDPRGEAVGQDATIAAAAGRHAGDQPGRRRPGAGRAVAGRADRGHPRQGQGGAVRRAGGDGPAHRPGARRRQLPDLRSDRVRRGNLGRRLRQADRARGRRPAGRPGDRRGVRAGFDLQADQHRRRPQHRRDHPGRPVPVPRLAGRRRAHQDQLRVRELRRHRPEVRPAGLLRHLLLRAGGRRVAGRPGPGRGRQEAAGAAAGDGAGVRGGALAWRRPARRRAGQRLARQPGCPDGQLEGEQGRLLRRCREGLPGRAEPRRPGLPDPAGVGELHRRLAVLRRQQRRQRHRPGRHHGVAAAAGRRVLGDGQRRQAVRAHPGLGRGGRRRQDGAHHHPQGGPHGAGRPARR